MSTRLTSAQRRLLEHAARHMVGRVVGGADRTRVLLRDRGLIESDGLHYKITDAGRRSIAKGKEGSP